jgi:hypothetical protein
MFKRIILAAAFILSAGCSEGKEVKPKAANEPRPTASKPSERLQQAVPSNAVFSFSGDGTLEKARDCSPLIGNGGNYSEGRTRLAGKCERGGVSPKIAFDGDNPYLVFGTSGVRGTGNDRAELAYTPMIPFDRLHTLQFRFRIPQGAPVHQKGQMFYPLQFWQCSAMSPIAGMRLVQGTSHEVDFMTRSQNSSSPVIGRQKLIPGQWYSMEIKLRPSLSSNGLMQVSIDGKQVAHFKGAFGGNPQRCGLPSAEWRVKFGVYKSNNAGPRYEVHYDDFVMTRE